MSTYSPDDIDAFDLASQFVQQDYPYSVGPFEGLDKYQASTPSSYILNPEEGAEYPISGIPTQIDFQANDSNEQQLYPNVEDDRSVHLTASIDAEQEIIQHVQLSSVQAQGSHSTPCVASNTVFEQSSQGQDTSTPERERYIRGGGCKDFIKFCSAVPGDMNNPFVLTRDATKHAHGVVTKSGGDEVYHVTIEDLGYKERYNQTITTQSRTTKIPNGQQLTIAELPWAKWTINQNINLKGQLPEDVDEVTHLTMYHRCIEGSYDSEDHLSWYLAWNTDFKAKNHTTGVWEFAKYRDRYEGTLNGKCSVRVELADGLSTVLPDVPMEMTIKLETVMPDGQSCTKEHKKIKARPKQPKTKTRNRPSTSRRADDRSMTSKYNSDSRVTKHVMA